MHDVLEISSRPSVLKCSFYYYLVMGGQQIQEMIGEKGGLLQVPKNRGMPGPQSHLGEAPGSVRVI